MTDNNWTPELRAHLDSVEAALAKAGVESLVRAGIIRDLEAQIAEMRSEENLPEGEILTRLDPPEAYIESYAEPNVTLEPKPAERPHVRFSTSLKIAGDILSIAAILLSAAAVLVERTTKICAGAFGDPMPGVVHFVGLLALPVIFLFTLVMMKKGVPKFLLPLLAVLNGYVISVSSWYTLMFMPFMLVAIPAIAYAGLGLLLLAPAASLVAAILQLIALRQYKRAVFFDYRIRIWRWWVVGLTMAVAIFGGWEYWQIRIDNAIGQVISGEPQVRESGIKTLKFMRAQNSILEYCVSGNFVTKRLSSFSPSPNIRGYSVK
jgi:hypothetical protein